MRLFGMDIDNASLALAALDTILCVTAFGAISGMFPVINHALGIESWVLSQQVWMVTALLGALVALAEAPTRLGDHELAWTAGWHESGARTDGCFPKLGKLLETL